MLFSCEKTFTRLCFPVYSSIKNCLRGSERGSGPVEPLPTLTMPSPALSIELYCLLQMIAFIIE